MIDWFLLIAWTLVLLLSIGSYMNGDAASWSSHFCYLIVIIAYVLDRIITKHNKKEN